ncbi:MAG: aldolase [Gammaproteobacteria bacterium]|nr:aldolase [Gammaproteobacteria bacterium]NNC97271.1 aldolase [Gammaproteobacteria bacterium]NNM14692.1 aldolase [Gammaproteobacteria bacterium]
MTINNKPNNFRQRLLSNELLIGSFVKTPSMMVCEVLGQTELDAICLDAEHAPFDRKDIDACLLALRSSHKTSLVRVASSSPEHILNALDCGATGVVVPHVDSMEKAQACVKAARYGKGRGYAGSTRAARYGKNSIQENLEISRNESCVIAQIEDLGGVDNIEAIAAVDGIDCLFIGMMDLSIAYSAAGPKEPQVIAAAEQVCKVAVAANRRLGIFVSNNDDIPFWVERGVSLFLLQSDHGFIKKGAAALFADANKHF